MTDNYTDKLTVLQDHISPSVLQEFTDQELDEVEAFLVRYQGSRFFEFFQDSIIEMLRLVQLERARRTTVQYDLALFTQLMEEMAVHPNIVSAGGRAIIRSLGKKQLARAHSRSECTGDWRELIREEMASRVL